MKLDQKYIYINSPQEKVFELIETMPNKFPVYKLLETKPFFFIRILLTGGFFSALKAMRFNMKIDSLVLNIGEFMGPFKLIEFERPLKYWLSLELFFMNCQTGYLLSANGEKTKLNFDITVEELRLIEKIWWFFIKPFHHLLADKVLKNIKAKAESV